MKTTIDRDYPEFTIIEKDLKHLINHPDEIVDHVVIKAQSEIGRGDIYVSIADLYLVLYVHLGEIDYQDDSMTMFVSFGRILTPYTGYDKDAIFEKAMANTIKLYGKPKFMSLCELQLAELLFNIGNPFISDLWRHFDDPDNDLYLMKCDLFEGLIVTSESLRNGATYLLFPEVRKKLYELLGEDYYIAFTSKHEAMIHRSSDIKDPMDLYSVLNDTINDACNDDDILSRKIYKYNGKLLEVVL